MFSGSYIGGSGNYVAMSEAFRVSPGLINAGLVADNLLMAVFFGLLTGLPGVAFIRRRYPTPLLDQLETAQGSGTDTPAASYWGRNEISLKDLAAGLAIGKGWNSLVLPALLTASGAMSSRATSATTSAPTPVLSSATEPQLPGTAGSA